MSDSTLRMLERKAAGGESEATAALARERERMGICPACQSAPPCYLLEGDGDDDEGMRVCRSALPPCEDCEGETDCEECDGDGEDADEEPCETCKGSGERPESCDRCEGSGRDPYGIVIDGDTYILESSNHLGYSADLWQLSGSGSEFIVAIDAEVAGEGASERWKEMAENDPSEFAMMVGEATLVAWALGQSAGPGNVHVSSLSEWLELVAEHPEEEWAGYDGVECEVTETGWRLRDELGFSPTVAYRNN